MHLVGNDEIYGIPYGDWPYANVCSDRDGCDSYVGLHPYTTIPLGTLANATIREARKKVKAVFNPVWQSGRMSRGEAYAQLPKLMGIEQHECHFGWFTVERCSHALQVMTGHRCRGKNWSVPSQKKRHRMKSIVTCSTDMVPLTLAMKEHIIRKLL